MKSKTCPFCGDDFFPNLPEQNTCTFCVEIKNAEDYLEYKKQKNKISIIERLDIIERYIFLHSRRKNKNTDFNFREGENK